MSPDLWYDTYCDVKDCDESGSFSFDHEGDWHGDVNCPKCGYIMMVDGSGPQKSVLAVVTEPFDWDTFISNEESDHADNQYHAMKEEGLL